MKKLILFSVLFMGIAINNVFSQDTIYYSKEYKKLKSSEGASKYKVVKNLPDKMQLVKWYTIEGQITSLYKKRAKRNKLIREGVAKYWHKNGQLMSKLNFRKGKKHGEQLYYWDNGVMCRKEFYKKGKMKKGECWDEQGNSREYFPRMILPKFKGKGNGGVALKRYIQEQAEYPAFSYNCRIEGKVYVSFVIDTFGNVVDVKIRKGTSYDLDKEALRIVKSMPKWTPGYLEGKPTKTTFTVPINFQFKKGKRIYSRND